MGIWIHRIKNIDIKNKRAFCSNCGNIDIVFSGIWRCLPGYTKRIKEQKHPYIFYKKDFCERCGFIPEDTCQLDVDHIDGNRKNNDPNNLQTLCANCHRLKTKKSKDYLNKY